MISFKFLLIISMLYKTEWSWELRTWSHKMNLIDTSTNSSHYFYWQRIGITSENLNFDVKVYTIGLLAVRKQDFINFENLLIFSSKLLKFWQGLDSKRKKNESWVRNKILERLRNVLKIQIYFYFLNNLLLILKMVLKNLWINIMNNIVFMK